MRAKTGIVASRIAKDIAQIIEIEHSGNKVFAPCNSAAFPRCTPALPDKNAVMAERAYDGKVPTEALKAKKFG